MNKEITSSIQVNQWKNFSVVIKWFRNIENKPKFSLIIFDIQEFYPSISLSLFNKAIKFVKEICILSNDDIQSRNQGKHYYSVMVNHGLKKMTRMVSTYQ